MTSLRAMTYNVHSCVGRDGRFDPARILRIIAAEEADVVAVQEIDTSLVVDGLDFFRLAARATGLASVGAPTLTRPGGYYGHGLLFRGALLDARQIDLGGRGKEPRAALDALLRWRGATLRVLSLHLGLRGAVRRRQLQALMEALRDPERAAAQDVTLLLGDFNEWFPWSRNLRFMRARLGACDTCLTFPSVRPTLALDRVYALPPAQVTASRVIATAEARVASDHLPLVAEVAC